MQRGIPGSIRTRHELSDLFEGKHLSPDACGQLIDLAARPIVEEALEAETKDMPAGDTMSRSVNRAPATGTATGPAG